MADLRTVTELSPGAPKFRLDPSLKIRLVIRPGETPESECVT